MKPITVLRASLPFESSPTGEESSEVPLDGGASSAELCELSLSDPPVSYTHLRAHETREDRVWRLLG